MINHIGNLTSHMDSARIILNVIKKTNSAFYNEFVREFQTDRLTFTNFEKDLVSALHAIAGITIYLDDNQPEWIFLKHGDIIDKFDDYESAFRFAISILYFYKK